MPARVALDLGSTGKALAADLAAAAAHAATGTGILVSLGGDIATAGPVPAGGWRIRCTDDSRTDPESDGEVISIGPDAVATSSTTVRRWTKGGIVRHHIVNPATGLPAEGPWRTATVVAATCVDANAASTAAIVMGERATGWLAGLGLPARLVDRDGNVTRIGGWPEPLADAA
jgi:FAD:protein FMN transferase